MAKNDNWCAAQKSRKSISHNKTIKRIVATYIFHPPYTFVTALHCRINNGQVTLYILLEMFFTFLFFL